MLVGITNTKVLNTNILDDEASDKDRERAINDAVKLILKEYYDVRNKNATSLSDLQEIMKCQAELANVHISIK